VSLADRDPSLSAAALEVVADDEAELIDRARTDRAAFAELYRRHVRAVFGYAYRLTGSKQVAEDLTSSTFERALRGLDGFRWQGTGIRPWLLRITANEAAGLHRRQVRHAQPRAQQALRVIAGDDTTTFEVEDSGPSREAMRAALATLPERYQQVIGLRYLAGLSADDAAAALGCSKATLAVTLHRALTAMRRALNAKEGARP
jgi:RNA polymerase sigma-70 factor (ECF subfamily)